MPIESDSVACSNTTAEPHEYFDHTGSDDVFAEHTGWSLCGPHPFAGLVEQPIELQGDHVWGLVERCAAAAFGMGRKTRYDRTVRDALQIKAEGGALSVLHFDPAAAGILEQIRRELVPDGSDVLTAELYNLNVYKTGGHFVPHKDTPRGSDMLGTLVVCLPAQFSNGAFVVKHHGVTA